MTEPLYRFQDQAGTYDLTRAEILVEYFAWWSEQMVKAGKADMISEDACIEDWVTVHWAWQVHDS